MPAAVPPPRVIETTADPTPAFTDTVGVPILTVPAASRSPMVSTAVLRGPSATGGAADEFALLSSSRTVLGPDTTLSGRIFTANDCADTAGANVTTPDVGT